MAYVSQEMKKELAVDIKKVLKKYGCKGNIGVKNHTSLYVDVMEGPINFGSGTHGDWHHQINTYWIDDHWSGVAKDFLKELLTAMKGKNYFCNDDIQTDYFCRSHYTDINVGKWNNLTN